MQEIQVTQLPDTVRADDQDAFRRLTEPYWRELLLHCYRILGSMDDAEDMLQETLVRAWRHLGSFEGRSSLKSWLYTIATNVSLDALDRQRRRSLPTMAYPSANPHDPLPVPSRDRRWLEPLPDTLIDSQPAVNPEARYEARETVTFAFLATLQTLPGRQRAVLILRDVLGWSASEAAEVLEMTVTAANSTLQRARTTMQKQRSTLLAAPARTDDEQIVSLLTRYVEAWEAADTVGLVALLREDAVLTMPPLPVWYNGRADIASFLHSFLFAGQAAGKFRLVATSANGAPAFASYQRDESNIYRPAAIHALKITEGQITEIHDFLALDNRLFSRFGMPAVG